MKWTLEKLSLPLVKHRRVDLVLVAQIRNGLAFDQMLAKDRDLLFRAKIASVFIVHRGVFFQASTSLRSAHDFPIPSEAGQDEYWGGIRRAILSYSFLLEVACIG